ALAGTGGAGLFYCFATDCPGTRCRARRQQGRDRAFVRSDRAAWPCLRQSTGAFHPRSRSRPASRVGTDGTELLLALPGSVGVPSAPSTIRDPIRYLALRRTRLPNL